MTFQIPDKLIDKAEKFEFEPQLLEPFFRKYPERKPETDIHITSLHRHYIAYFEIVNEELILKDIKTHFRSNDENGYKYSSILSAVMPHENERKIDWFTGFILKQYTAQHKIIYASWKWVRPLIARLDEQENPPTYFELMKLKKGRVINREKLNVKQFRDFQ